MSLHFGTEEEYRQWAQRNGIREVAHDVTRVLHKEMPEAARKPAVAKPIELWVLLATLVSVAALYYIYRT